MKKTLKKLLVASVAAGTFIFNPPLDNFHFFKTVQAEVKTYTGVGKCVQGDLITIEQAKNYARLRAEINAKEQAGVYLRGYTKAQKHNLTENKIEVITNSIINIVGEVQYKTETAMIGDSPVVRYIATLQANIDTEGINAYIRREDKAQFELPSTQKEIKENLDKIDNLIERYNRATSQAEKDRIRAELNQADRNILAEQKIEEGWKLYHRKNYNEALKFFNEAIELNSKNPRGYHGRGLTYKSLKNYNAAIEDLNKALELNPNEDVSFLYPLFLGEVYLNLEKYEQAIKHLDKSIKMNPHTFSSYLKRGEANDKLKNYEQAIKDYSMAMSLYPYPDESMYNNRGVSYLDLKNYNQAIDDFNKAIELSNNFWEAYHNRGIAYLNLKNYSQAIADFNKAIEINRNYDDTYFRRGNSYFYLKKYDQAIADYNKAIELNSNYASAYYNRGLTYKNLKQYYKAIADFTKYIELGSHSMWVYKNRAECYQALDETEKAEADFAKAKELGYKK